jgi:SSS family solute:Na+ symporter
MKADPDRWVPVFAMSHYAKGLAQDMYQALWSCVTCIVVTVLVTLVTRPKPDAELVGLVYSLTPLAKEEHASFLHRPLFWGIVALVLLAVLQIIFR